MSRKAPKASSRLARRAWHTLAHGGPQPALESRCVYEARPGHARCSQSYVNMTAVAFRAFPSSFLSTVVATGLALANSVAVAGCANGVEAFPGNQVIGLSGAAAGSGSTLGSGGSSFGAGVSAGASGTII